MLRRSVWSAVLAAGILAGCSGGGWAQRPGTTAEALTAAWAAPNAYDKVAAVTISNDTDDAQMAYGLGFTWYFAGAIEDDETPYGLQEFYKSEGLLRAAITDLEDVENSWLLEAEYALTKVEKLKDLTLHVGVLGGADVGVTAGADYQILEDLNLAVDWKTQGPKSSVAVGLEYVAAVKDQKLAATLDLILDTSTSAGGETLDLGVDYYLMKELSLGATLGDLTSGDLTYEARAKYYSGPLAVSASFISRPGVKNDAFTAAIEYRF